MSHSRSSQFKKRHGCLTAYLIFMLLGYSLGAFFFLVTFLDYAGTKSLLPGWFLPTIVVFEVFNLACVFALFQWKMWGFWGSVAAAVGLAVINVVAGLPWYSIISSVLQIVFLFGVLQIGGRKKGWSQLE